MKRDLNCEAKLQMKDKTGLPLAAIACAAAILGCGPSDCGAAESEAGALALPRYANGRVIASERIMGGTESRILSFAADGGDRRALVETGFNLMPSCSRDGKRILFSARSDDRRGMEIWVMNAGGEEKRQLTFDTQGGNFTPIESPDGRLIAFTGQRGAGPPEVWVMNVDGSGQRQITTTPRLPGQPHTWSLHPAWSADGKRIAYASTRSGSTQIWVMDANGGGQTQLTRGLGDGYPDANVPCWSFDGKLITFWAGKERQYGEVWVMEPGGKSPRRITDTEDPWNSDDPHWAPDGTKIIFGRGLRGNRAMHIVDVKSGKVTAFATGVHWCDWQPIPCPMSGSQIRR